MKMTNEEYRAYVRKVQHQEKLRQTVHRLQEDFKVFISYSHTDEETVRQITDLFDVLAIKNYIIDKKELEWGDDIREFAKQKIDQCTHYLLVLSEASVKSKWCAMEFGIALGAKKEILLFLTSDDVKVPAYAANVLATSNVDVLTGYFSRDLILPEEVEKLVAEIIDDGEAKLSEFKRVDTHESGRICWEAPDKTTIESKKRDPLSVFMDDYKVETFWRLVRIELSKPFDETALVLHYYSPDWRPQQYKLSFRDELRGIIVKPKKSRSHMMGVRLTDDDGTEHLVNRTPSVKEHFDSRDVHGWPASRSFWEKTFEALKNKLPG